MKVVLAPVATQLTVVIVAASLGEHPADVVTIIPLHVKHRRGHAPLGIVGVSALT